MNKFCKSLAVIEVNEVEYNSLHLPGFINPKTESQYNPGHDEEDEYDSTHR